MAMAGRSPRVAPSILARGPSNLRHSPKTGQDLRHSPKTPYHGRLAVSTAETGAYACVGDHIGCGRRRYDSGMPGRSPCHQLAPRLRKLTQSGGQRISRLFTFLWGYCRTAGPLALKRLIRQGHQFRRPALIGWSASGGGWGGGAIPGQGDKSW